MRIAICSQCEHEAWAGTSDAVRMRELGYVACRVGRPGVYTAAAAQHRCEMFKRRPQAQETDVPEGKHD